MFRRPLQIGMHRWEVMPKNYQAKENKKYVESVMISV